MNNQTEINETINTIKTITPDEIKEIKEVKEKERKETIEKKPKKRLTKKEQMEEKKKELLLKAKRINANELLKSTNEDIIQPIQSQHQLIEPNGTSKSKNQLSSLAYSYQQNEDQLKQKNASYSLKKKTAKQKYGW